MTGTSPLPEHVSAVSVSDPIDGAWGRRGRGPDKRPRGLTHHIVVDPRVMEAARAAILPGQRLVIVDATTVRLVNDRNAR